MKLQVQKAFSGELTTIELLEPLHIVEDEKLTFNRICSGNGFDYFFYKDGSYDGWGKAVSTQQEAETLLEAGRESHLIPHKMARSPQRSGARHGRAGPGKAKA